MNEPDKLISAKLCGLFARCAMPVIVPLCAWQVWESSDRLMAEAESHMRISENGGRRFDAIMAVLKDDEMIVWRPADLLR